MALAASVAALFLLAGCNSVLAPQGASLPQPQIPALADDADPIASDQHARIVAAYGGIYRDENLEKTLARIVGRLVAASEDPSRSYRITILNAAAINAFALPDGYLYVTRGLLTLANDSSEVAAVLAHEMAHVTADHAAQRQDQQRTAALVGRVVNDVIQDPDAGRMALASSQRSLASFSRQQEFEADEIGIRTIGNAGYDPFAASRFLRSMSRFAEYRATTGVQQERRPEFLATHPNNPERIDLAVKAARAFGAPGIGEVDHERYLQGIDNTVFGDDTDQGYVRGRTFIHARLQVGFTVPEGYVIDNTQQAVLATGPDGSALRFDAVSTDLALPLSDYLVSGWVNGIDPASVRPLQINGLEAASASASAKGWQFRITVIRVGGATYRFIFANESSTAAFDRAAASTAESFRRLSAQEAAGLRPLRVRVVPVKPGETPASIAGRMSGVERPLELFQVLNELEPGRPLEPGRWVKIVVD
jgi:predicted Zn-dependent protease